jgi:hypothetical protein
MCDEIMDVEPVRREKKVLNSVKAMATSMAEASYPLQTNEK